MNLTTLSKFVRSEIFLLFGGAISLTLFLAFIYLSFWNKPAPETTASWRDKITAGNTTKDELEKTLGKPENIENKNGQTIYSYPSTNEHRPDKVSLDQDKVTLVKQQVIGTESGNLRDYIQKYGQPGAIVYGPHGDLAPGNFWGDKGLLVFATEREGGILEIWYFAPSSLEEFLAKYPEVKKTKNESKENFNNVE